MRRNRSLTLVQDSARQLQRNFTKTELAVGQGWHEARLRDLDGDGDLDLLNKPYTWETPRVDVWLNGGTR